MEPGRSFFDERPPFTPFARLVRRDPFRLVYRVREAAWARALRGLPLGWGDLVVDVGGWSGIQLDQLHALRGIRGVVVDVSLRGLRQAASEGVALRPVCADARRLPFPDGAFAAAVSFDTLEHVDRWHEAARELVRVTRPGGGVVVSAVSSRWRYTWDWWLAKVVDVTSYAGHDPENYVDPRELARVLELAGARVRRVELLNPFATLAYDQAMMVAALGVERFVPLARAPFLRLASAARAVLDPLLRLTELPWLLAGLSNSVLVVAERPL